MFEKTLKWKNLNIHIFFSFNSVSMASAPSCWIPLASQGRKCPNHYIAGKGRRDIYQIPLSGKIYIGDTYLHTFIQTNLCVYIRFPGLNVFAPTHRWVSLEWETWERRLSLRKVQLAFLMIIWTFLCRSFSLCLFEV